MTALTHENNFLHSFIKGLGSMLSFAPPPRLSQIPTKSNAEIWAEAWKMTGDSLYETMGRTPPSPLTAKDFEKILPQEIYRDVVKFAGGEVTKKMPPDQQEKLLYALLALAYLSESRFDSGTKPTESKAW